MNKQNLRIDFPISCQILLLYQSANQKNLIFNNIQRLSTKNSNTCTKQVIVYKSLSDTVNET